MATWPPVEPEHAQPSISVRAYHGISRTVIHHAVNTATMLTNGTLTLDQCITREVCAWCEDVELGLALLPQFTIDESTGAAHFTGGTQLTQPLAMMCCDSVDQLDAVIVGAVYHAATVFHMPPGAVAEAAAQGVRLYLQPPPELQAPGVWLAYRCRGRNPAPSASMPSTLARAIKRARELLADSLRDGFMSAAPVDLYTAPTAERAPMGHRPAAIHSDAPPAVVDMSDSEGESDAGVRT